MTRRLEGKAVAEALLAGARSKVEQLRSAGRPPPVLASVHRGAQTPFAVYLRRQSKAAASVGIGFRDEGLPPAADTQILRQRVAALNQDPTVHAVILEHPLPPGLDFLGAIQQLRPEKDVDGVGPLNLGLLVSRRAIQAPAVARGAMAIARHYGVPIAGQRVTVIGRSETVGVPLALLLLARGEGADATVTVAHSRTRDLAKTLASAQVIFSCAGAPGLLSRSVVPEGSVVIDVGLSTVPDATQPSGQRVVGDADATALEGWVEALTPVPGGVGPVTVAQLMANAVHGWELLTGRSPP
ncbi:MAG TPA: bifunctional 5,10-methylenetetrahydrofolate dehydrogenase/5,10-methenyltetrahydrofolate cyclohydrolase [Thermoplasmata archaeon]|nr:bifunctional 5,10-methylenetetrahydrofolate dehydrogenase/5,10-methenyltetrahydrofolate cyclohydrolase [Thermoplasmata archaeon]